MGRYLLTVEYMNISNIVCSAAKVMVTVIVMIAGLCLLSVLLCSIPGKYMRSNVLESLNTIEQEGFKHRIGGIPLLCLDNFTDAIIVSNAYCVDAEKPLESVMRNTTYLCEDDIKSIVTATRLVADGDYDAVESTDYVRYWHGASYMSRLLLMVTNLSGIRLLGCLLMLSLAIWLAVLLFRADRHLFASFVIAALVMNLWIVPLSVQFTSVFYISIISTIVILTGSGKEKTHCCFFAAVGCLTSYFDLLTVPLVSLCMPLTVLLAIGKSSARARWFLLLACSLSWLAGYGIMWASKWLLAYLMIDYNVAGVFEVMAFRTSTSFSGYDFSLLGIVSRLFASHRPLFFLSVFLVLVFLGFNYALYRKHGDAFVRNSCLLGVALMPFVWCFVLRNHSVIHYWFVWRVFFVSLFAYTLFLFNVVSWHK